MFTIDELKKELCIDCPDRPMDSCKCGCLRKAVLNNFISLKSENEQLKQNVKDLEDYEIEVGTATEKYEYYSKEYDHLQSENEQLKKQLDKAVEDINKFGGYGTCICCKNQCKMIHHADCYKDNGDDMCANFEWCGLEADNEKD